MRPCSPQSIQERMLLFLFKLLGPLGIPQFKDKSLQSLFPSSHGLPLCVSLMKIPVIGFRIHPESRMSLGHVIDTSAKTLFSSKVTFHRCWGLGLGHVFGGNPSGSNRKESACNSGDSGLIPGSGRSPGEGNDISLQYSSVEYPMDRGAWWAVVHWECKESDTTKWLTFTLRRHCSIHCTLVCWIHREIRMWRLVWENKTCRYPILCRARVVI